MSSSNNASRNNAAEETSSAGTSADNPGNSSSTTAVNNNTAAAAASTINNNNPATNNNAGGTANGSTTTTNNNNNDLQSGFMYSSVNAANSAPAAAQAAVGYAFPEGVNMGQPQHYSSYTSPLPTHPTTGEGHNAMAQYQNMMRQNTAAAAATTTAPLTYPQHHYSNHPSQYNINYQTRVAQLFDENDHKRCSDGNRKALLAENLDQLRGLIKVVETDDWKYHYNAKSNNVVSTSLQQQPSTTIHYYDTMLMAMSSEGDDDDATHDNNF